MKIRKIYHSNHKGITLLEVVIVIAIIGILTVPMYNIMFTNDKLVNRTSKMITAKDAVVFVQQALLEQIEVANSMQIGRSPGATTLSELTTSSQRALYFTDGELVIQKGNAIPNTTQSLCSKSLLGNYEIIIEYTTKSNVSVEISISAKEGSELLYNEKIVTSLMNLKTDVNDEKIVTTGSNRNYIQYSLPTSITTP
ncbi:MAG: prepilin-type N-terminal cleavage/methylation domain-containing protein [Cellulosilyticaceae bacterium]